VAKCTIYSVLVLSFLGTEVLWKEKDFLETVSFCKRYQII